MSHGKAGKGVRRLEKRTQTRKKKRRHTHRRQAGERAKGTMGGHQGFRESTEKRKEGKESVQATTSESREDENAQKALVQKGRS